MFRRAQLEIDVLKASVGIQRDATVDLTEIVKAVDLRMAAVETASIVPADEPTLTCKGYERVTSRVEQNGTEICRR